MSLLLVVFANHWAGSRVPCTFQAWADNNPLSPKGGSTDTAPVYEIPSGTGELKLTAKPSDSPSPYWDQTVFLTVGANALTAKKGSEGFVIPSQSSTLGNPAVTFAKVILSRFKDYTTETRGLLDKPPGKRRKKLKYVADPKPCTKPDAQGWVVCPVDEVKLHTDAWGVGNWPPPNDWKLRDVPDAHFLDLATPVNTSKGTLNFATGSPTIDGDNLVLRLAGVDAPQLFAVTWPKVLAPRANASPTPFFIFIRQENIGNEYDQAGMYVGADLDSQPYPDNFDYADTLFEQLHYAESPLFSPGMKGVPYQVTESGADAVTVIPCNSFGKEFGFMEDTEQTGLILQELQAFMFLRAGIQTPPASVGKTAIASFSSGNFYLGRWLAKASNVDGNFLSNVVTAVYFLDPILFTDPKKTDVKTFIKSAMEWAKKKTDKRIRLYMRFPSDAHVALLGKSFSAPYIQTSDDKRRTAAVLADGTWVRTFKAITGRSIAENWQYTHHVIAATMLTHALAQGDLA